MKAKPVDLGHKDREEAIKVGRSILDAYREMNEVADDFGRSMDQISTTVGATSVQMEEFARKIKERETAMTRRQRLWRRAEFAAIRIGDWIVKRVPGGSRLAKTLERVDRFICERVPGKEPRPSLSHPRFATGGLFRHWAPDYVIVQIRGKAVSIPPTNHKRELQRERIQRSQVRLARYARRAGYEIGWLCGIKWDWPWWSPQWRPYDWAIDGLPPTSTRPTYIWGAPLRPPKLCNARLPSGEQCKRVAEGERCASHLAYGGVN